MDRHSKKLEAYLGRRVQIEFKDGTFSSGVLRWNERYTPQTPYNPQVYVLEHVTDGTLLHGTEFRKSHVKAIREI